MLRGLPQWRCHKVVGAFKIHDFRRSFDTADWRVYPEPGVTHEMPIVRVDDTFFRARTPDNSRPLRFPDEYIGGYLVQYEDGYLSWSPAAAFEAGYTRLE